MIEYWYLAVYQTTAYTWNCIFVLTVGTVPEPLCPGLAHLVVSVDGQGPTMAETQEAEKQDCQGNETFFFCHLVAK